MKLGAGVIHTFLSQVLSTTAAVALILVTSRALGPEGKGLLTLALLGARVVDMAISLGIGHALMFYRAKTPGSPAQGHDSAWSPAHVSGAGLAYWALLSGLLAGGGLLLALPRARAALPAGLSLEAALLVLAIGVARLLHYFAGSILLGEGRLPLYNKLNLLSGSITAGLCAALIPAGGLTVERVLWAYLAGATAAGLAAAWKLAGAGLARPPRALMRACLGYGAQIQLGQVAQFLNSRLDQVLVGFFLPIRDVGLYAAAVSIGEIVWRLPNVVATVLYPLVARTAKEEAMAATQQACRFTTAVVTLACSGMAAAIVPLVRILFGPEYDGAMQPTLFLLPGMITLSLFTLLYHDLAGRGRPGPGLAATVAGLLVTVSLDLILIPRMGINGAALASSVAYTVSAAWVAVVFLREARQGPARLLWPTRADLEALRNIRTRRVASN